MTWLIEFVPQFKKSFKKLSKRYASLPTDLSDLLDELVNNPFVGDCIQENYYKVRLAVKSKNRGKSGGARVIYRINSDNYLIILLIIFDKNDQSDLADVNFQDLINASNQYLKDKDSI